MFLSAWLLFLLVVVFFCSCFCWLWLIVVFGDCGWELFVLVVAFVGYCFGWLLLLLLLLPVVFACCSHYEFHLWFLLGILSIVAIIVVFDSSY